MALFIDSIDRDLHFHNKKGRQEIIKHTSVVQLRRVTESVRITSYPLQKWSKTKEYNQFTVHQPIHIESRIYSAFRKRFKTIAPDSGIEDPDSPSTLRFITTIYNKKISIAKKCHKWLEDLYPKIFTYARDFVSTNRGPLELQLFDKLFDMYPRHCHVNFYKKGQSEGLINHRDPSSFCTVVLHIYGDNQHGIILTLEDNTEHEVKLDIGDAIVFGRIDHKVPIITRTVDRMTINVFF